MKHSIIFCIITLISCVAFSQNVQNTSQDLGLKHLEQAKSLLNKDFKKNAQTAIHLLESIIYEVKDTKAMEDALLELGMLEYNLKNDVDTQLYLKKLAKMYPNSKHLYDVNYTLYKSYARTKNTFNEKLYLKKTYFSNENGQYNEEILPELIKLAVKEKNYKLGMDFLKKAYTVGVKKYKREAATALAFGEILYFNKRYSEALIEYNRIVNLNPTSEESKVAYARMGDCHLKLKEFRLAEKAFINVMTHWPDCEAFAMSVFSLVDMILNDQLNAIIVNEQEKNPITLLDSVLNNPRKYTQSILGKASILMYKLYNRNNEKEKGMHALINATEKYPKADNHLIYKETFEKEFPAYVREIKDNSIAVIKLYEDHTKQFTGKNELLKIVGDAYQKSGNYRKSDVIYRLLIEQSGQKDLVHDALLEQADLYYKNNELRHAGYDYNRYINNFSRKDPVEYCIARIIEIFTRLNEYQNAIDFYNSYKTRVNSEKYPLTLYYLAKSYKEAKDVSEAEYFFKEYLKKNTDNKNKNFEARLFLFNQDILKGSYAKAFEDGNTLLKMRDDDFIRFQQIRILLSQEKIKEAKKLLSEMKKDNYWNSLASENIELYEKTGTVNFFRKEGREAYKENL